MTKTMLGRSFTVVLCILYSLWLSAHGFLLFLQNDYFPFLPVLFATLLALFIGFSLALSRMCRRLGVDKSGYWRCALIALLIIPIVAFLLDAPPIKDDYDYRDVVSTDPLILESYDTLMLFRKDGGINIERVITPKIYCEIQTNAIAHSELIYNAWDSIAEARSIIEKLDTYPGIADLTPQVVLGTNTPVLNFVALRSIGWTYAAYARLMTAEEHPDDGVHHLATLQLIRICFSMVHQQSPPCVEIIPERASFQVD